MNDFRGKLSKGHLLGREITGNEVWIDKVAQNKVRLLDLFQYLPAIRGIYSQPTFQLISYDQLHWTHTKEVGIASLGD